jgi:outer membrane immunogenic protein
MKKLILVSAAVSALAATPVFAADLPVRARPAPPVAVAPAYDWTGFYVGASLGGRWSDVTWTTTSPSFPGSLIGNSANLDSSTVRAGGYVGYNWQFAPNWLVGIEGDIAWGDSDKSLAGFPGLCFAAGCGNFDTIKVRERWDASLRGRLGFLATPTFLIYATGGAAWQDTEVSANCLGTAINASYCAIAVGNSVSTTKSGWTVGGGVETILWTNWLARLEYRFADYGTIGFALPPAPVVGFTSNVELKTHTFYGGLAYKF